MLKQLALGAGFALAVTLSSGPALAAQGERVRITGEMIDTWCYFSGVMGGPDAVVGTAHHTCALWCAAGGIPVGLLADDGTVYMVIKWLGSADVADGKTLLSVQSHRLTADGIAYERDGIHYLVVEEVVEDEGIVNLSHQDYGVTPPFAFPDPAE
ncbi:MAG: hypothetical protein IID49_04830 [Proteobacteria bacterium]|nr:hypothetical protein [Pseudomonadota bacterium]